LFFKIAIPLPRQHFPHLFGLTKHKLFDYVVERGTLSEEEASAMLRKITSAVAHMHRQGIIHRGMSLIPTRYGLPRFLCSFHLPFEEHYTHFRNANICGAAPTNTYFSDLKPENLLLTREGAGAEIKIIDFGLSKMLPAESAQTTQSFLGTRGYLAPEMLKRQAYAASVDVWALGVIAFILLCGCLPFDDDSAPITDAVAKAKFQLRLPHWAQNISADAKDFLQQLLESDAKVRTTAAAALEHPWLNADEAPASPQSAEQKKKLLASPKHLRNVPRTPKRGTPGGGSNGGHGGPGGDGGGMPPVREAAGAPETASDRNGQKAGIGAAVGAQRSRGGSF
jgi:serine/threonine protein kinase